MGVPHPRRIHYPSFGLAFAGRFLLGIAAFHRYLQRLSPAPRAAADLRQPAEPTISRMAGMSGATKFSTCPALLPSTPSCSSRPAATGNWMSQILGSTSAPGRGESSASWIGTSSSAMESRFRTVAKVRLCHRSRFSSGRRREDSVDADQVFEREVGRQIGVRLATASAARAAPPPAQFPPRRPGGRAGAAAARPGQRHLVLAALLPQLARLAARPLALADGRPAAQVRQREKALVVAAVGRPDNRVQRRMLTNR